MSELTVDSYNKYAPAAYHGAVDVFLSMEDTLPIIHGTCGCSTYAWTNIMRASLITKSFPSTALTDRQLSSENGSRSIVKAIEYARENYNPNLIGVISTHFTDIIGENIRGLIAKEKNVLYIPTASLQNDESGGKAVAMLSIVQYKARKTEVIKGSVNIIGPTINTFNASSDIQELINMMNLLGVKVNTIFPYKCSIQDIENISRAELNLVMYPEFGEPVAQFLQDEFGIKYLKAFPIGYTQTVQFLEQVCEALDIDRNRINCVTQQYEFYFECYGNMIRSPWFDHLTNELSKFAIIATPTIAFSISDFLVNSLGMDPLLIGIIGGINQDQVKYHLKELGIRPTELLINPNSGFVKEKLKDYVPSVIFGTDHEEIVAEELGISGFIPASHPSIVTWGLGVTPFIGFRGSNFICHEIFRAATKVLKHIRSIGVSESAINSDLFINNSNFYWTPDAREKFDQAMALVPAFLGDKRKEIAKKFKTACENLARTEGVEKILSYHVVQASNHFSKMFTR